MKCSMLAVLAACGGGSGGSPDGPPPFDLPDAVNDISICFPNAIEVQCLAGVPDMTPSFAGGSTSRTLCGTSVEVTGSCSMGCAVETVLDLHGDLQSRLTGDLVDMAGDPDVLCVETAPAKIGDACVAPFYPQNMTNVSGELHSVKPCLPTRAQLAADGTVTGQTYLACQSGQCVAAPAPTIASYLQACDAAILAAHSAPGTHGVVVDDPTVAPFSRGACLLAFDNAAQHITSGVTIQCVGDWECPAQSLCDDQITNLSAPVHTAICKPGPRGMLTPAMLTP